MMVFRRTPLFLATLVAINSGAAANVRVRESSNPVVRWSRIANEILPTEAGPVADSRAMAILHGAIHDAVNAVSRRYHPYAADSLFPGASLDAAVASAARRVLLTLAPGRQEQIAREYMSAIAAVPEGSAKERGVMAGELAARANLERRDADAIVPGPWPPRDGPITRPVYAPTGEPGNYDFTPPFDAPPLGPIALFPGWGRLKPFAIDLAGHRFAGPDPLNSDRYARDLARLKAVGSLHSTTRTPDQTAMAFFWFESLPIWNDIARTVIERRGLDAWQAARILARMNFAIADAAIASFEAKYRFRFWRPYTAIRRAADDGNAATEPDAAWLPLLWTPPGQPLKFLIPPIPDYPSLAAVTSGAAAEVLTADLGDHVRFDATSAFLPGATRRFESFADAAHEAGWSRVYGGVHFVHAVEDGLREGAKIGRVVSRALPPIRR